MAKWRRREIENIESINGGYGICRLGGEKAIIGNNEERRQRRNRHGGNNENIGGNIAAATAMALSNGVAISAADESMAAKIWRRNMTKRPASASSASKWLISNLCVAHHRACAARNLA
jgi:hypothetical protein